MEPMKSNTQDLNLMLETKENELREI